VRRSGFIFAISFVVFNLNLRPIPSGDTAPAALLPLSLVAAHTTTLDRFAAWYRDTGFTNTAWFTRSVDGHYYSSFPIAVPLLVTPLYAPFAFLDFRHMPAGQVILLARVLEKISASLIAALSVVAFFHLIGKLADTSCAWLLTVAYAFGSPTWAISSQALWQHGPSELALILGLLLLIETTANPSRVLVAALAGCSAGFAAAIRLSNLWPCVLMGAYVALAKWPSRSKSAFAAGALLPLLAVLAYNLRIFGSAFGTYPAAWLLEGNLFEGVTGLLFSPSRGLFIFCPIFLFSVLGAFLWFRDPKMSHPRVYLICLLAAAAHLLFLAKFRLWWGGYCYGPRVLTDVVPCLVILMIPAVRLLNNSRVWKAAFAMALAFSISVQAVGAFCYPNGHWDALPRSVDEQPQRLWDWRDNQIARSVSAGPVLLPYRLAWVSVTHPASLSETLRHDGVTLW